MGKKIYIIHGWAYSIAPWTSTVSLLKSRGFDVVQLRVPGLTTESDQAWTIDQYVAWLHEELGDDEDPIVLGHSNGGRIALHYAAEYPERIKKLILLSAAGVNVSDQKISLKRRVFRAMAKIAAPLKHIPLVRKAVYRVLKSDYEHAPKHMKQTLANMLASDTDFSLETINTPAVLLWGKADQVTTPAQGKKMAEELPHASIHMFDGWGHAAYRTYPNELARAIARAYDEEIQ